MNDKYIIGLHLLHTSTAVLIKNSDVLFAFSEERLNRIKVYAGFPILSLLKILELSKIKPEDISMITIPSMEINKINKNIHKHIFADSFKKTYLEIVKNCGYDIKKSCEYVLNEIGINCEIEFYDHHTAHASSAFYTTALDNSLIVTADGYGDDLSMSVSIEDKDNLIKRVDSVDKFYSIGRFYSFITYSLGFEMLRHEGKITGLAAFGNENILVEKFKDFLSYDKNTNKFSSKILDKLTNSTNKWKLRFQQRILRFFDNDTVGGWLDYGFVKEIKKITLNSKKEDIAAGAQKLLEDIVVDYVTYWKEKENKKNLILAGGVFANVKLNQKLLAIEDIKNIYIHPGMGDEGLALGSAFLGMKKFIKVQRQNLKNVYLGESFSNECILDILNSEKELFEWLEYKNDEIIKIAAQYLANEEIVAICTGRMEYGPRALGARTIMANAKRNSINDTLNKRLKRTEFMPFAPVVLDEYAKDIFEGLDGAEYTAEFMTITCNVKKEWKDKISATVHVDGTARPQIIKEEENSLYYNTIKEFYKLTGVPVLVNTSFNIHEEPIVDSPKSALKALSDGAIDYLMLENFIVKLKR